MGWREQQAARRLQRVECSVEIDAPVDRVFARWSRLEQLPQLMEGVRRTKRIGERRVLWDADVFGRQVVWEAEIVELSPEKRIRWESRWGAVNAGEVHFQQRPGGRTLLSVELWHRPSGFLERLGARLGLVRLRVQRDLAQFARSFEAAEAVA